MATELVKRDSLKSECVADNVPCYATCTGVSSDVFLVVKKVGIDNGYKAIDIVTGYIFTIASIESWSMIEGDITVRNV